MLGSLRRDSMLRVRGRREPFFESPMVELAPGERYAYIIIVGDDHLRYVGYGASIDLYCVEVLYTPTPSEAAANPAPPPATEAETAESQPFPT
jgi:hypothetical protein